MWFLDARVEHLDQNVRVFGKIDHELLPLLHVPERVVIDSMCVMEEQIVLRGQLNPDLLDLLLVLATQYHDFTTDCLEGTHLLRSVFG